MLVPTGSVSAFHEIEMEIVAHETGNRRGIADIAGMKQFSGVAFFLFGIHEPVSLKVT